MDEFINHTDLDIDNLLEYESSYGFGGLLDNIAHDIVKEQALKKFNDTYHLMPSNLFIETLEKSTFLFKKIYQRDYKKFDGGYNQELMFFNDGILVFAEAAEDGKIEYAKAWLQVDFKNAKLYSKFGRSAKLIDRWIAEVELYADEAFLYNLIKIDLCGAEILKQWHKYNAPSVLNLNELDAFEIEPDIDAARILIHSKLAKLPTNVRNAIKVADDQHTV